MRNRYVFNDNILSKSDIVKYLALHLAYATLGIIGGFVGDLDGQACKFSNNCQTRDRLNIYPNLGPRTLMRSPNFASVVVAKFHKIH